MIRYLRKRQFLFIFHEALKKSTIKIGSEHLGLEGMKLNDSLSIKDFID